MNSSWTTARDWPESGVKARIDTGRPGPTLALIGELDALTVAGHPQENPETHAAHACGHNAQIAGLMARPPR